MHKNELIAVCMEITQNTMERAKKSFNYFYEIIINSQVCAEYIMPEKRTTFIETKHPLKTSNRNVTKLKISKTLGDALN